MPAFKKGYALIVGVANYQNIPSLPSTILNDVSDFHNILTDTERCGYLAQQTERLVDQQATADSIRAGLLWLANSTQPHDTAIFFFSGHGGQIASSSLAGNYLFPFDTDPSTLEDTAIEGRELSDLLSKIQAGRLLVIIDACHAGGIGDIKDISDDLYGFKLGFDTHYYDQLSVGRGRIVIASSQPDERSWILSGMRNSVFTHYVLEAMRGQAQTYHDGFIGVLDLFNYVSEALGKHHDVQQHPILKGEISQNFPIVLYLGGQKRAVQVLRVENPHKISLFSGTEIVLRELFDQHQRVIIEKEFGGGFSGGRVILMRPIRNGGTEELPAVAKFGSISLIQQEWEAYRQHIMNRLPLSIGIQKMSMPSQSEWGGLLYLAAGEGTYRFQSFPDYYQETETDAILRLLEGQLLPAMEKLYERYHVEQAFSIQRSYDPLLPINLLVHPTNVPPDVQSHMLTPATVFESHLTNNQYVRIEGFAIRKIDTTDGTVTLNLPPDQIDVHGSFTLRLDLVGGLSSYQVNQIAPAIEGIVVETRDERLQAEVQRVMGPSLDLASETFTLSDGTRLPNPLKEISKLLNRFPNAKVGTIHGDLNVENILVYPKTNTISLIDFASAREDHLLHDFFRLESEILVKLVASDLAKALLGPGHICSFYQHLHNAIAPNSQIKVNQELHPVLTKSHDMLVLVRRTIQKYLVDHDDWSDYYQGLILYLLGALKFRSLDEQVSVPMPKQLAFLGAATLLKLLNEVTDHDRPTWNQQNHELSHPYKAQMESSGRRANINISSSSSTHGIPSSLYIKLKECLLECGSFYNDESVRAVFIHEMLKPWRNRLPEATNATARTDAIIAFLFNKYHAKSRKNALVLFLQVLAEQTDPNDTCYARLYQLAQELNEILD